MISTSIAEPTPYLGNPLDLVQEIVAANEWAHERVNDEELSVEVSGRWCDYRLEFLWQEDISLMHFCCNFDIKLPKRRRAAAYELLALVNEKIWIGHFDLSGDNSSPAYRHGVLLRGLPGLSIEQVEDLLDIALSECERFYPAFHLVFTDDKPAEQAIAAAMIDPVAEA
ncbi:MAG TPA: YbjN domain-containing protein [Stellaceae bacterium]|nr:YbjN domain-containing protein [Stellaceae bacterium]